MFAGQYCTSPIQFTITITHVRSLLEQLCYHLLVKASEHIANYFPERKEA